MFPDFCAPLETPFTNDELYFGFDLSRNLESKHPILNFTPALTSRIKIVSKIL